MELVKGSRLSDSLNKCLSLFLLLLVLSGCSPVPAAVPTGKQSETISDEILDYYSQLIKQIVMLFPTLESDQHFDLSKQKRMFGRPGRDVEAVLPGHEDHQFDGLEVKLEAELARRQLGQQHSNVEKMSDMQAIKQLKERLNKLEEKLGNSQSNGVNYSPEGPVYENMKLSLGEGADRSQDGYQKENPVFTEGQMDSVVEKYQEHIDNSEMEQTISISAVSTKKSEPRDVESNHVSELAKLLSGQNKVDQVRPIGVKSTNFDDDTKIDKLSHIVKNLIEVNELAYIRLTQELKASKTSNYH